MSKGCSPRREHVHTQIRCFPPFAGHKPQRSERLFDPTKYSRPDQSQNEAHEETDRRKEAQSRRHDSPSHLKASPELSGPEPFPDSHHGPRQPSLRRTSKLDRGCRQVSLRVEHLTPLKAETAFRALAPLSRRGPALERPANVIPASWANRDVHERLSQLTRHIGRIHDAILHCRVSAPSQVRSKSPTRTAKRRGPGREKVGRAVYRVIETDCGPFVIVQSADGRVTTGWASSMASQVEDAEEDRKLLPKLATAFQRYFKGQSADFSDVETPAGPPFFRACWNAARKIPRGRTVSYAELARKAGSPGAARAAGQAMRNNPVPIVVPCHRVIGSSGALHGFAGSDDPAGAELRLKRWLLDLERAAETFRT